MLGELRNQLLEDGMESRAARVSGTAPALAGPLPVLHCEDTPSDAELVERILRRWHTPTE